MADKNIPAGKWFPLNTSFNLNHKGHVCGREIYYEESQAEAIKAIQRGLANNFNMQYIMRQLNSLKGHGFMQSFFGHNVQNRILPVEGATIHYDVVYSKIFIKRIEVQNRHIIKRQHDAPCGVYRVEKAKNSWIVDTIKNGEDEFAAQTTRLDARRSKHIAVNGFCDDITDAAEFLPDLIKHGYQSEQPLGNQYHLFFNPVDSKARRLQKAGWTQLSGVKKGRQGQAQAVSKLVQILREHRETPLCWTLHESGIDVFKQALKQVLKTQPTNLQNASDFSAHTVFYANPIHSLPLADNVRENANMKLSQQKALVNGFNVRQLAASTGSSLSKGNLLTPVSTLTAVAAGGMTYYNDILAFPTKAVAKMNQLIAQPEALSIAGTALAVAGTIIGAKRWGSDMMAIKRNQSREINRYKVTTMEEATRHGIFIKQNHAG
ncbi:hypothetical protein [Aliikangiella sp. IMCC44359]|uniref:hypothetical protein n=1 Tax=Aliikangiella sp. IMCC44359 TaxID=3459125 RepID=UPI00403B2515